MVGRVMRLVLGLSFGNGFRNARPIVVDGFARGVVGCGVYCFHGGSIDGKRFAVAPFVATPPRGVVQSRNAMLAMARVCVSVFINTRCQPRSVMTAWSLCRTVLRAWTTMLRCITCQRH